VSCFRFDRNALPGRRHRAGGQVILPRLSRRGYR
jgi:hypothetical protein